MNKQKWIYYYEQIYDKLDSQISNTNVQITIWIIEWNASWINDE